MMHGVFLRAFVRSTEDPEKVIEAIRNICPSIEKKELKIREHKGIYGNLFLSITYEGRKKEAEKIWRCLWDRLDEEDKAFLSKHVGEFIDEGGNLHIRIRKQDAFRGRIRLGTAGVIKIVFRLEGYPARYENYLKEARRLVSSTTTS